MPYPLNNVTLTSDTYIDTATAKFQLPVDRAVISIFNQAVYVQVMRVEPGMRADTGDFLAEEYKVPGVYTISRGYKLGAVRFRRNGAPPAGQSNPQVSVV